VLAGLRPATCRQSFQGLGKHPTHVPGLLPQGVENRRVLDRDALAAAAT
jgi:hypothetical protein